jgi:hypothetical protein
MNPSNVRFRGQSGHGADIVRIGVEVFAVLL